MHRTLPHRAPNLKPGRKSGRAALTSLVIGAALAACGGGREDAQQQRASDIAQPTAAGQKRIQAVTVNPSGWVTINPPNDVLFQNLTIPADAPTRGMWSGVGAWPMLGLHQAVLPDGKVLTWGTTPDGGAQNGRYFDVWDPNRGLFDAGAHNFTFDPNRQDSFCAPALYLNDGRLMITGGNGNVTSQLYTPSSNTYAQGASVADSRWYAAMVTLADGRAMMLGGINPYSEGQYTNPDQSVAQGLASMTPEVFENGAWRTLFGAQSRQAFGPDFLRASLPKVWLAPDGRVFGISSDQMYYVDPNGGGGNGAITLLGQYKPAPGGAYNNDTAPNVGPTMTGVMYAPGKVLTVGGNAYHNGVGYPASRKATSIDLNGGGAVMTEQPAMAFPRNFANVVVMPDGKVLATGGETRANNDPGLGVYEAEMWNPATGTWATLARAAVFRGYHSQTALLTNGTVLSTGGGNPGPIQLKGEVFYPPYLFRSVGGAAQLAPRPQIVGISGLGYANGAPVQFDMAAGNTVSQVALIGLSVGTHSFNSGQRRIPLTFTQEGIRVSATLPANTLAPPGYYQVVAIDSAGVPSRGTVIAVGQGVNPPSVQVTPYTPPALVAPVSAPAVAPGATATYTVAASAGVTYSWNFGDGSAATPFSAAASATHVFANPGVYGVTVTIRAADGATSTSSFLQAVAAPATAGRPVASSATALEPRTNASARLWVANPDTDTVAVLDTTSNARVAEIAVGQSPRSVAIAPDGRVWVTNKGASTISIINPATLTVAATVAMPRAAQPHGLVFAPGGSAFVVLEATGQLLKLDPASGAVQATLAVGANPRHVSATANGATVLVSRFITNPLPGESTAVVDVSSAGAEVLAVNAVPMTLAKTIVLRHSDKIDNSTQGSGIPNYLAAAVVSPDGRSAWVPSKQDNIQRGTLRNGQGLDFQNSVRAISSRIDMAALAEDYPRRVDHDNSSLGAAAAFHPNGAYLFVALETSRQVAVVDATGGRELARVDVGRAPQALAVSADGTRLYVQNFMDRSVSVLDLGPLTTRGLLSLPTVATVGTVATERLAANLLQGKQLFYDARDPRLARDSYMSCASCHSDAGHDGRTWDFTGFGEGLRNTPALKGRAGMAQGFVHWSANFDEIQDFEGQIRAFAGGTGLMSDAQFNTGTRKTPLGDRKAGISADLDALAAYMGSLAAFDASPHRQADGTLTPAATAGKAVFAAANCISCHNSGAAGLRNIGTVKPTSGLRLGAALTGIDVPTLLDVWKTAPYLHDGSAGTLSAAVQAHAGSNVAATDLTNLVAYLREIGVDEANLAAAWNLNEGTGASAADASGGNRPLALANTAWVAGKVGQALRFNGVNASGSTAGALVDTAGSFSVATWVKLDALAGWQTMVGQDGAILSGFWLLYGEPVGGKFALSMHDADNGASTAYRAVGTTTPVVGQWYHVVGVRDKAAGTMKLYVNGRLEGTTAYAGGWASNGPLSVGRGKVGGPSGWLAGAMDEVRVYGGALTDADVAQLHAQGSVGAANVAPTVALAAPANNASVVQGTAITVTANAADSDGNLTKVDFFDGTTLIGTDTAAPWSVTWTNATAGVHTLTARATDNAGAVTTSAARTVTVTAPGPANLAPTVALTAPANNASVAQGTAITVTANAADGDGSVARVDFYDGTTLIGTDTAAPWSVVWTNATAGVHTLTARATDNAGAVTTSPAQTLTVTGPANLAGTWSLNEGTGATSADASGASRALTLANTTWVAGKVGQGLKFNGVNASGSTAGALLNTAGSFSVATWVKLDSLTGWQTMASQDGAVLSGFWLLYGEPVGRKFALSMYDADSWASTAYRAVGTTTPVAGQWYHVAAVRDKAAGTMKIYVNGRLEGTTVYTGGWASNGPLNIGRGKAGGPSGWLAGAMDEVRIYGGVLTDADVAQLHAQGNALPASVALTTGR